MFEVDQFVADCRAAFAADSTHKAIREVLARAMSEPAAVLRGLGEPNSAEIRKLFHSDSLTILNVVWAPGMMVMPHNHRMWAVIGIYSGREDNIFWRRIPGAPNRIEAAGAKSLLRKGRRATGIRHYPFGHQPDRSADRRNPYLWRRFLCGRTQRMGLTDT
jgi:hypothetical protein